MRHVGNGACEQWGIWAIGHVGNRTYRQRSIGAMGHVVMKHMAMRYKGNGA